GLDRIEDRVLALHEIVVDALGVCGRLTDDGSAAYAGLVSVDDREDLDTADVAGLEESRARPDVRKLAAFAGGHDHELELLGSLFVDAAGERGGDVHLAGAGAHRVERVADGGIGDAGEALEQCQLTRGLDLA